MTIDGLDREQIHNNLREDMVTEWTDRLYEFHRLDEYPENENERPDYHPEILGECIGEVVNIENLAEVGIDERNRFLSCYVSALAKNGIPYIITHRGELKSIDRVEAEGHPLKKFGCIEPENIDKIAKINIKYQIWRSTIAELYLDVINENRDVFSGNCKKNVRENRKMMYKPENFEKIIENIQDNATKNESHIFDIWQESIDKNYS